MQFYDDYRTGKKIARFSSVKPKCLFAFIYACRTTNYQAWQKQVAYADVLRDRQNGLRP